MNLGGQELLVILVIILVLFGARKLPELARGMGQAIREFQKAKDEFGDELNRAGESDKSKSKTDVVAASSTVPRIENAAGDSEVRPDPIPTVEPSRKTDSV